jgi:hypothetical protein
MAKVQFLAGARDFSLLNNVQTAPVRFADLKWQVINYLLG